MLRQVQARLGYCSKSNLVADYELRLERDGEWDRVPRHAAKRRSARTGSRAKEERAGRRPLLARAPRDEPRALPRPDELDRQPRRLADRRGHERARGRRRHRRHARHRAPRARRSSSSSTRSASTSTRTTTGCSSSSPSCRELGSGSRARVWLLATGQQKLEDSADANNLGKLKDRFPPQLRVHLGTTNIRDVVHKRLLKKKPDQEPVLRELFQKHRGDLKLHGYGCEEITEEDFVEVYPMLPGHVDLLMQITSNLRTRSTRVQGDDHAIRGLLQLLGELFREQKLAEREVGVAGHARRHLRGAALGARRRRADDAVAHLRRPRGARRRACPARGQGGGAARADPGADADDRRSWSPRASTRASARATGCQAVTEALEKLRQPNLLAYSEKQGFKIQSSAGQEWQRERDDFGVTQEQISEIVQDAIKSLVG